MQNSVSNTRTELIQKLASETLDVLVIGGGIVGSGIARDAAMRGLRVGLVEQHDFAFGTSSRSSRLLHGGLRYLAQGRVGLVHEASVEKKVIHHIAPHLAEPLPFIFPTFANNKEWVLWRLKIGVKIYDLLCGGRNLGKSSWLGREETLRKIPGLSPARLTGAVRYYDGFTNDARLVIDTLRSAARNGAFILNYCQFANANCADTWECDLSDTSGGKHFKVRARCVVNATGPWAEGLPHSRVKLRTTKGVHLVVARARVPVSETVVMTEGKRILFAIPWGGRTILGTTDTDYSGSLENVKADDADIEYLLRITNQFFPEAKLAAKDLISAWAGLRPLIANPKGGPSDITRSHQIRSPEPGWWDVAGGKLTTYRLMAEQTTDQIVHWLRRNNALSKPIMPCRTAQEPLLPSEETRGISGILPPEFGREVVKYFCAHEWVAHLDDLMVRRTSWKHYLHDCEARAAEVAEWMAQSLGWDAARKASELNNYLKTTT